MITALLLGVLLLATACARAQPRGEAPAARRAALPVIRREKLRGEDLHRRVQELLYPRAQRRVRARATADVKKVVPIFRGGQRL